MRYLHLGPPVNERSVFCKAHKWAWERREHILTFAQSDEHRATFLRRSICLTVLPSPFMGFNASGRSFTGGKLVRYGIISAEALKRASAALPFLSSDPQYNSHLLAVTNCDRKSFRARGPVRAGVRRVSFGLSPVRFPGYRSRFAGRQYRLRREPRRYRCSVGHSD